MGSSAVFVVIFFVNVIFLILYIISVAANRAFQDYKNLSQANQTKLIETRRKQDWIREQVSLDWPIWPRPLLFKELDYSTQLALGRSYHANEQLEKLNRSIKLIQPLPASLAALFNADANLQRIRNQSENKYYFVELDKYCQIIDDAYQIIVKNRAEINAIKKEIKRKVEVTTRELAPANENLQFFQRLGTNRYKDALRNVEIAQTSIDRAHVELANAVQEDLIEWAAADLLCFSGLISLSIFKLKGRSYTFSETFEADLVLLELARLTDNLEGVLDFQHLHQWRELVYQKNQLLRLSEETVSTEGSLADFEAKVQYFNRLIMQLSQINVREISARTLQAQLDLEEYIGTPAASGEWERILSRYKLPSVMLEENKTQFIKDIEPSIQGTIIKQSTLLQIIRSLEEFLKGIQKIQSLIRRIEGVTQHYVRCENEVKQLLGHSGEVERLVQLIYGFSKDTAEDIKQECVVFLNDYQNLSNVAFGDRKIARYPLLLEGVRGFKDDCEVLIARHEDAIRNLQNRANNYYRELRRLQNALVEYQYKKPVIQFDWSAVTQAYNQLLRIYDERGNHYSAIAAFNETAQTYLNEKGDLRRALEQEHQEYQQTVDGIMRRMTSAQRQINQRIEELSKNWLNPLSDYIRRLKQYEDEYKRLGYQLQAVGNESTMQEAMNFCMAVSQRVTERTEQQRVMLEEAFHLKLELDELKEHIDRLRANKKLTENNMKAVSDANQYILAAQNTYDPYEAQQYLNTARIILEQANMPAPTIGYRVENFQDYQESNPDYPEDSSRWNTNREDPKRS